MIAKMCSEEILEYSNSLPDKDVIDTAFQMLLNTFALPIHNRSHEETTALAEKFCFIMSGWLKSYIKEWIDFHCSKEGKNE